MHTPDPINPRTAQQPEPRFIRVLLTALTITVLAVAIIANGAAYLGGVAFVHNVMHLPIWTARIFGGVIELALAVVAAATFIEAWRMQPTTVFRTATWALSGVSGTFGALFEITEYLGGTLTIWEAVGAAGWRLFAPFLAAGLWELVIHLFCGARHRAHRAAERQHALMFRFFRAVETEGLVNGTWRAPLAATTARRAARRIAKHVPPAVRDAALATYLASQQYSHGVRVQGAALAAHTDTAMRSDLTKLHTPETIPGPTPAQPTRPATAETPQVQDTATPAVQDTATTGDDYSDLAAAAVQAETDAITATAPGNVIAIAMPRANSTSKTATERFALVRALLERDRNVTGNAAWQHLQAAGYSVSERTAYNDLSAAKSALSTS